MPSILVKSLAIDLLDTYKGNFTYGRGGFRRFEFYLEEVKYLFPGTGLTIYIDPSMLYGGFYPVWSGFDTSLPVTGSLGSGWLSSATAFLGSPLRIIVVFDEAIEIDKIVFNNHHDYGGSTDTGIKSLIITVTEETLGQTDVDSPISPPSSLPGAVEIFNGEVLEHVSVYPSDVRDDQVLDLSLVTIPTYSVEIEAAIELFGGFDIEVPPPKSVELSAIIEMFGGFEVDIVKPVELSAIIELFGGFSIDVTRSVELSAAIELLGGFDIETSPLVSVELSAAIELFGGFEIEVDVTAEMSAVLELFGGFNVHIDATECRLPKFDQSRWC